MPQLFYYHAVLQLSTLIPTFLRHLYTHIISPNASQQSVIKATLLTHHLSQQTTQLTTLFLTAVQTVQARSSWIPTLLLCPHSPRDLLQAAV